MTSHKPVYLLSQPENAISFIYFSRKYLTSKLHLINPTNQNIAFRIKTNVPTSYLVKPHSGYLSPSTSIEINITMQPTEYDPHTSSSLNDKFLINAIPINEDVDLRLLQDPKTFNTIWDSTPKSKIQGQKLGVELNFDLMLSNNGSTESHESKPSVEGNITDDSDSGTDSSTPKKVPKEPDTPKWKNPNAIIVAQKNISSSSLEACLSPGIGKSGKKEMFGKEEDQVEKARRELIEKISLLERKVNELTKDNTEIAKKTQEVVEKMREQEKKQKDLIKEKDREARNLTVLRMRIAKEKERMMAEKEKDCALVNEGKVKQADKEAFQLGHLMIVVLISMIFGAIFG